MRLLLTAPRGFQCLHVPLSAGVAFPIALAGIVDSTRADRNTGLMVSLQVVFGAVGVYVIDEVRVVWRLDARPAVSGTP